MTDRLPVLWVCGPPAVGKTTVGWQLFSSLPGPIGYLDIDQIGMGYGPPTPSNWAPEPFSDVGRHHLKARNLDAVASNFRAAGARGLIVSGVVDPVRGVTIAPLPHVSLTAIRLRADPSDLRARVAHRNGPYDDLSAILENSEALDRLPGLFLDTTGRSVADVVRTIREQIDPWPAPPPGHAVPHRALRDPAKPDRARPDRAVPDGTAPRSSLSVDRPGEILWLCGPAGIGKSAVGWFVYQQLRAAGRRAAFVDLDQVGFRRPAEAGNHRLRSANLAALWYSYTAEGADCLVVVGPVTPAAIPVYTAALPSATFTLARLTAGPATLAARIQARGRGESPASGLAGDRLVGRPSAVLDQIIAASIREAEALESAGVGDLTVPTDHRSPPDIATEILNRL